MKHALLLLLFIPILGMGQRIDLYAGAGTSSLGYGLAGPVPITGFLIRNEISQGFAIDQNLHYNSLADKNGIRSNGIQYGISGSWVDRFELGKISSGMRYSDRIGSTGYQFSQYLLTSRVLEYIGEIKEARHLVLFVVSGWNLISTSSSCPKSN